MEARVPVHRLPQTVAVQPFLLQAMNLVPRPVEMERMKPLPQPVRIRHASAILDMSGTRT